MSSGNAMIVEPTVPQFTPCRQIAGSSPSACSPQIAFALATQPDHPPAPAARTISSTRACVRDARVVLVVQVAVADRVHARIEIQHSCLLPWIFDDICRVSRQIDQVESRIFAVRQLSKNVQGRRLFQHVATQKAARARIGRD